MLKIGVLKIFRTIHRKTSAPELFMFCFEVFVMYVLHLHNQVRPFVWSGNFFFNSDLK